MGGSSLTFSGYSLTSGSSFHTPPAGPNRQITEGVSAHEEGSIHCPRDDDAGPPNGSLADTRGEPQGPIGTQILVAIEAATAAVQAKMDTRYMLAS
ncbi:hypothetical protein NDU88_001976 [Pleurodeles waltl]|uniref:Uncharacterized protein n=1 Tax=Pleurodeles waltl TaxID=8319 RepID=A0AAV7ML96_PLEWA|nr:hypothetical protein NDU88_001976 [Pleurodeles waltl]